MIDNLPHNAAVEVPCHVHRNGIQPICVGPVPVQLAAILRSNINVQELTVMAVITSKKDYIFHAAAMDPHTSSELMLAEIEKLVDALIAAYGKFCPRVRRCPYEQL